VEGAAQAADQRLRPGGGVAFPVEADGTEAVALIQETGESDPDELERLATAVRQAVLDELQIRLAATYLVPPRSILKTSSGKVRRSASREALRAGQLTVLHERGGGDPRTGAAAATAPA
jgi:acyl-CoA synthetase (AMP-forming)/AMP-acid ligase II